MNKFTEEQLIETVGRLRKEHPSYGPSLSELAVALHATTQAVAIRVRKPIKEGKLLGVYDNGRLIPGSLDVPSVPG